jgi:hypothetical protein
MPQHHGLFTAILGSLVVLGGCDRDTLKGPEAEVRKVEAKFTLPAVPAFALPPPPADGSHTVKELRVRGAKLLGTEITVTGVITWAYDCPTAIRQPGMQDKELQKLIEEDPSRCERPKFYLGDTPDTPADKSLWVVDVPRPYYKVELERLSRAELRNPPPDRCDAKGDPRKTRCPPYRVGDQVQVTGMWSLQSPHSERNSIGLLVYKRMKNVTQDWESAAVEARPDGAPAGPGKESPSELVKAGKG